MATVLHDLELDTVGDLLDRLGDVSPRRIRLRPPVGTATEDDLLRVLRKGDRLYELVEGALVEKVMGYGEGGLAADLVRLLGRFLDDNDLGDLVGPDTGMRLLPGLVRIPDVSFISWDKLPGRQRPTEAIPDLVPDLAVEVLSESNTAAEMERKRQDYFAAGVRLVWIIDPRERTLGVYTAPGVCTTLHEADTLDGGDVLPGLQLPVQRIFARTPLVPPRPSS